MERRDILRGVRLATFSRPFPKIDFGMHSSTLRAYPPTCLHAPAIPAPPPISRDATLSFLKPVPNGSSGWKAVPCVHSAATTPNRMSAELVGFWRIRMDLDGFDRLYRNQNDTKADHLKYVDFFGHPKCSKMAPELITSSIWAALGPK